MQRFTICNNNEAQGSFQVSRGRGFKLLFNDVELDLNNFLRLKGHNSSFLCIL